MRTFFKIIKRAPLFGAALLAVCAARAEPVFSWDKCVKMALDSNPVVGSARKSYDAEIFQYRMTKNQYYPAISLGYNWAKSRAQGDTATNSSLTEGISQSIVDFGALANISIAEAQMLQSLSQLRLILASARNNLLQSFITVLYAQEKIKVVEKIYAIRNRNARIVDLQYEGGTESKGNSMRASALSEQAKVDIARAKRQLAAARRQLAESLGMQDYTIFTATGALALNSYSPDPDIDSVADQSPQVEVNRLSYEIARRQYKSAGADMLPTLYASQSYGLSGAADFPQTANLSVGLSLKVPIFSAGPTYMLNARKSAEALMQKSAQDLLDSRLSTRADAQAALSRLESAYDDVNVSALLLAAALQREAESSIMYMSGRMVYENWEQVEQEYANNEKGYLDSLREFNLAKASWENLLGIPLGE